MSLSNPSILEYDKTLGKKLAYFIRIREIKKLWAKLAQYTRMRQNTRQKITKNTKQFSTVYLKMPAMGKIS